MGNGQFGGRQIDRRKIRGDDFTSRIHEFDRVPPVSATEFEDKSMCGFLFEQRKPFIEPEVFFHEASISKRRLTK
jgi:hypothetical protein